MTVQEIHALHEGELLVQKRRNTPNQLTESVPSFISKDMPQQHADFFTELPYLPLAILDEQARPWASLLVTKSNDTPSVGIQVTAQGQMDVVAETNPFDPFARALTQTRASSTDGRQLFAGVGIDFTNRRRNKLAGTIESASRDEAGTVQLTLNSDQHLGNCPKYITVRSLEHDARTAELVTDSGDMLLTSPLLEAGKDLINRASTLFLATKHTPENSDNIDNETDMGLNHRGGAPGFVRLYEETHNGKTTTYLILPDHSGNRFYQSLGNIETNKQVGLVFPDFISGDILYITGNAENLYNAEADALMPRVSLLTRIQVTGAVFVKSGLNLKLTSAEELSPYNPPIKYLRQELEQIGRSLDAYAGYDEPITATMTSVEHLSDSISTFTFDLSSTVEAPLPGGFGVFDFSRIFDTGYSHMNEANPQMVNEDYIRTWTLSSAPRFNVEKKVFEPLNQISITVKRKTGGLISNFLHEYARDTARRTTTTLPLEFKGTGVGFSCFKQNPENGQYQVPQKMLWIAGGVGITPFMSMWDSILDIANASPNTLSTDITLLFSGRGDDITVAKHFLAKADLVPANITIKIIAFQSGNNNQAKMQSNSQEDEKQSPQSMLKIEQRRIQRLDLKTVTNLLDQDIYMCGPDALMNWNEKTLSELGVNKSQIHQESFFF